MNGKQGHFPIYFLNSAFRDITSNESNCQTEEKMKRSDENLIEL